MNAGQIIFEQLGANKFAAMTGAHGFHFGDDSFGCRIKARAKKGINMIIIKLDDDDTYTVTLHQQNMRAFKFNSWEFPGIYCDQLKELIKRETGLDLSL